MEDPETKPIKIQKKIQLIDFIYLSVIFLFFIIIIILFFSSTNFILKNVNKIFTQTTEIDSRALDMEKYTLIEKKLNLPVNNPNEIINTIPVSEVILEVSDVSATPEITAPILDKKSITINILNAAKKSGVASSMAKNLETAGFPMATIGDSPKVSTQTVISIKESKKDYNPSVEEIVKKSYPNASMNTNPENSKYDVVIVIGK